MQTTSLPEDWPLHWAVSARAVPGGRLLAGFLVDLVADPSRVRHARAVCFPLTHAAHALGLTPPDLESALRALAEAELLTVHVEGPAADPDVTVTLRPVPADRAPTADDPARTLRASVTARGGTRVTAAAHPVP
ncbi:hypothetical protein [Streptomyces mangrovisoli]|uniref:Uncharacterized protein n=1 Tax=Streptomyces mangrovisoli TaxID=1428628 RepID=A0A1J4P3M9_9ACTN|nr:hypothetical protein [Streptomyces mangrovisoli]OIJ68062.1 hypothetical protein WN71_009690 [Streptomyces mangrovisoli]